MAESKFIGREQVKVLYPTIHDGTLYKWLRSYPALGRPVRTEIDPQSRRKLFSTADLKIAVPARLDGPPPNEFADSRGRWLWTPLAENEPWKMSLASIARWRKNGHPAIGGKPLEVRVIRYLGTVGSGRHDFVRCEDLEQIRDYRQKHANRSNEWIGSDEAKKTLHVRLLTKHTSISNNYHPKRKSRIGVSHPALGRPIRAEMRPESVNGKTVWKIWYFRPDLIKIQTPEYRPLWATRPQAKAEYPPLEENDLERGSKNGTIKKSVFSMVPAPHIGTKQIHFLRSDLQKAADAKTARLALPRVGQAGRHFDDAEGRWWPGADAARRLNVRPGRLFEWRSDCPLLGRVIRAKHLDRTLRKNRWGKAWFYLEADIERIFRVMNKLPEPVVVVAEPKPARHSNKRGKPLTESELERQQRLLAEWARARPYYPRRGGLEKWCAEQQLTVKTYREYDDAERKRRSRSGQI